MLTDWKKPPADWKNKSNGCAGRLFGAATLHNDKNSDYNSKTYAKIRK